MAQKIVAGNWKMKLTLNPARELFADLVDASQQFPEDVQTLVIPPFPFINPLYRELPKDTPVALGAQNCHEEEEGAYTGEVSAPMLASIGCEYCIVGHSERRRDFNENDEQVLNKSRKLRHRSHRLHRGIPRRPGGRKSKFPHPRTAEEQRSEALQGRS